MLRITTDENAQALTLRLEGRLYGEWVEVLAQCFSNALPRLRGRRICVALNGLTFVDVQGKAQLAQMYAQGAELLGENIEAKAIVAEIRGDGAGPGDDAASQASNHNPVPNLSQHLANLQCLRAELHEVNEELSSAARPLDWISELNFEQRQQVRDRLRAGFVRWESVTQRIAHEFGLDSANGQQAKAQEGVPR